MSVSSTIALDYVTKLTSRGLSPEQKCSLALEGVGKGRIIIFEGGLNPREEAMLITQTMEYIDHEDFFGVEIYSDAKQATDRPSIFRRADHRITIVAPAQTPMEISTR